MNSRDQLIADIHVTESGEVFTAIQQETFKYFQEGIKNHTLVTKAFSFNDSVVALIKTPKDLSFYDTSTLTMDDIVYEPTFNGVFVFIKDIFVSLPFDLGDVFLETGNIFIYHGEEEAYNMHFLLGIQADQEKLAELRVISNYLKKQHERMEIAVHEYLARQEEELKAQSMLELSENKNISGFNDLKINELNANIKKRATSDNNTNEEIPAKLDRPKNKITPIKVDIEERISSKFKG